MSAPFVGGMLGQADADDERSGAAGVRQTDGERLHSRCRDTAGDLRG